MRTTDRRKQPNRGEQPTLYFPAPPADDLQFPAYQVTTRPRSWRWLLVLLLLVGLLVGTAVIASFMLLYASPLLLPGTQIMGTDVSLTTVNETAVTLDTRWRQTGLTLESDSETWDVSPEAIGIELDAWATAEQAHAYGRSLDGLIELATTGKIIVPLVYELDTAVATAHLQTIAPQLERAPVNAAVQVVNGRAEATPAIPGQSLNIQATVEYLSLYQEAVLAHGRLPLSYSILPPAISDVSGIVAQINELLSTAVTITAYDPIHDETITWNLPPEVWGNWVSVEIDPDDTSQLTWNLDSQMGREFLAAKGNELGDGPKPLRVRRYLNEDEALRQVAEAIRNGQTAVTARIYHAPTPYTVQSGDTLASIGRDLGIPYPWIQQANPGIGGLNAGQIITIPSPDEMLPLPVVPHKRIIVSISNQTVQVFENGQLKWDWPTSTGIASSPTAPGIFQVQSHEPNAYAANWNLWMPNFMGIYRPVPTSDFMNGFHGFPTRDGYNLLWTNNLGAPVTYGCLLLSNENAQALYDWAEEGVVVEIRP